MDQILEQLLPILELRLGHLTISAAAITHPQHGTGTLDKKFRPSWIDMDTSLGQIGLFLKAPHHAEPGVYQLLEDLGVPAPRLWGEFKIQGEDICVLDDSGRINLAQLPGNSINHCQHTPEAVLTALGHLHGQGWGQAVHCAAVGWRGAQFYLRRLGKMDHTGWEQSPYIDSFAANLDLIDQSKNWLSSNLDWVFTDTWALTHGDASAVNVAVDGQGNSTLVDWGDCRVSTCLWDLPQLVNTPEKFRVWYHTLVADNPLVPSHDELYAKYLGASLYNALASCTGRLTCWRLKFGWMPQEFLSPQAVSSQFQQLRAVLKEIEN